MTMRDNDDRMVRLLERIAQNTGGLGDQTEVNKDVDISGQTADGRVGLVPIGGYVTVETSDLDPEDYPQVNSDGSVTLEPGDSVPLCEVTFGDAMAVYSVGATDATNVSYELRVNDQRTVGGVTNSPLGTLNSPFSFVQHLGGAIPASTAAQYWAHYSKDATGTVDLAGRMHVEVMQA